MLGNPPLWLRPWSTGLDLTTATSSKSSSFMSCPHFTRVRPPASDPWIIEKWEFSIKMHHVVWKKAVVFHLLVHWHFFGLDVTWSCYRSTSRFPHLDADGVGSKDIAKLVELMAFSLDSFEIKKNSCIIANVILNSFKICQLTIVAYPWSVRWLPVKRWVLKSIAGSRKTAET